MSDKSFQRRGKKPKIWARASWSHRDKLWMCISPARAPNAWLLVELFSRVSSNLLTKTKWGTSATTLPGHSYRLTVRHSIARRRDLFRNRKPATWENYDAQNKLQPFKPVPSFPAARVAGRLAADVWNKRGILLILFLIIISISPSHILKQALI